MKAVVGGRLESVTARPITDLGDRLRLFVLVLLAVGLHVWVVRNTFVTARDSIEFARIALQLRSPNAGHPADAHRTIVDVLRDAHHPPGYPLMVLAVSEAVRRFAPVPAEELPGQMLLSAQLAAAIAGVLLVFPTYGLGRKMFGKLGGFAAAAIFQVLPVTAHVTSDGLSQGPFLLGVATTLYLGVRAIGSPRVGTFLQCGLVTGLTYLVRPEGLFAGAACGLVAVALWLTRSWTRKAMAGRVTALAIGAVLPAVPYMLMIGGFTNKPTVRGVLDEMRGLERPNVWKMQSSMARPAGVALFADWYVPARDGMKAVWVLKAVAKETTKTIFYAPLALAFVGLYAVRRRLRTEPMLWVPIVFAGLNIAILTLLGYRAAYVSERHTLPLALVGCLFVGGGLVPLGMWMSRIPGAIAGPKICAQAVLIVIILAALPGAMKPLHEHRVGHVYAGKFLAKHAAAEDTVVDPFEWAQFYAGRTLYVIPPDQKDAKRVWAVVENTKEEGAHSRLPRLPDAMNVASDGRAVVAYSWPENVPEDQVKVKVVRLDQ